MAQWRQASQKLVDDIAAQFAIKQKQIQKLKECVQQLEKGFFKEQELKAWTLPFVRILCREFFGLLAKMKPKVVEKHFVNLEAVNALCNSNELRNVMGLGDRGFKIFVMRTLKSRNVCAHYKNLVELERGIMGAHMLVH